MSSKSQPSSISDQQSQKPSTRVGRPPTSRDDLLAAADSLFQGTAADRVSAVTMDAVAAAAGVGKGTLFRAFGDREGLLDALSGAKFEHLRTAVDGSSGRFSADASAADRLVDFLDAVLAFKLENANLMRAREGVAGGDRASDRYRWMHAYLGRLLVEAAPGMTAKRRAYTAHVLLAGLQINLLDELLAEGQSVAAVRRAQREHVRAILGRPADRGRW